MQIVNVHAVNGQDVIVDVQLLATGGRRALDNAADLVRDVVA